MRIGINTRLLLKGKMDGIGWFTYETVKRIVLQHPEHEYYFFFDRKPSEEFIFADNVHPVILFPPSRHPVLWYMFFQWSMRQALKRYKIDLLLSTDGYIPLDSATPILSVIHDLNFEHAEDNLKPSHQKYMTYFFPQFARYATRIATVSQYSKEDISKTYNIDSKKIDVVYNGANSNYAPIDEQTQQQTRNIHTGGNKYFIFVSTILKRKNLNNLLKAFDIFRKQNQEDIRLVVVGARAQWSKTLQHTYQSMQYKDSVHLMGRVEPEELKRLVGSSEALVYPSFFEGFGIPIIEAFYAETAVITSNLTSMPEVAGDAALLIDPYNPEDISQAMNTIHHNRELRETLITRGIGQRKKFSWDKTASLLWDSLMKTIGEK